jgi:phage gp37-like protein
MISEIENAILARITAAHDGNVLGYKLKKIATYGGEFSDGLDKIAGKLFPFILVAFAGCARQSHTNARIKFSGKWVVFCGASNLRNEAAARHGAEGKVGSYQIVKDVVQLLANQKLGLDIDPIIPQSVQAISNDK